MSGETIKISSLEDLCKIGNDEAYPLDGKYEQTCDIDASGCRGEEQGFNPIGYGYWLSGFNGMYNGNGFAIKGLYINNPLKKDLGLFKQLDEDAEVTGINIVDAEIIGNAYVGGLAGTSKGVIDNCSFSGTVTCKEFNNKRKPDSLDSSGTYCGGLVGSNEGLIVECTVKADISGDLTVGGLVGYSGGNTILNGCTFEGTINGNSDVGGLAGCCDSRIITRCRVKADVNGGVDKKTEYRDKKSVGGLIGNAGGTIKITKCCYNGDVKGITNVGGLIGEAYPVTISDCHGIGNVSGDEDVDGLIGYKKDDKGEIIIENSDFSVKGVA